MRLFISLGTELWVHTLPLQQPVTDVQELGSYSEQETEASLNERKAWAEQPTGTVYARDPCPSHIPALGIPAPATCLPWSWVPDGGAGTAVKASGGTQLGLEGEALFDAVQD